MDTQTTLPDRRETLATQFEAHEAGTVETIEQREERARDDVGRFAKQEKVEKQEAPVQTAPQQWAGPSTWKREYRPMWDKLASGQPLDAEEAKKLAQYNHERENDFKAGVSTYRTEALAAKDLQEAFAPIMPELQAHGTTPREWLGEVYKAQKTLTSGTPEQKAQLWYSMAARYNIPIQQQGQINPMQSVINDLMGQITELKKQVGGVSSWRGQMETEAMQAEVNRISGNPEKYPHFEALREPMAQYLESGAAKNLDDAYKMAERMSDDLYEQSVAQRIAAQAPQKPVVQQAKAKAVSPKSATPSGTSQGKPDAKDRRAMLAEKFDEVAGERL